MKFRCCECDALMAFDEQRAPDPGTLEAVYACPGCGRRIAMVTNPLETQLVESASAPEAPRVSVPDAPADPADPPWSPDAVARLGRVPPFVRGVLQQMYTDFARDRGIPEVTPTVMDRARDELGFGGM